MQPPVRLLQTAIFNSQYIGGLERTLLYLLEGLPKDRFDVTVALVPGMEASPFGVAVKQTGVQVVNIADVLTKFDFTGMYSMVHTISNLQPHIVHIHMTHSVANPFLPFAVRLARVPRLVATEQTNTIIQQKTFGRVRKYLTGLLIDKTIAVSYAVKQGLIDHYGLPSNRIEVIENGIDVRSLHKRPSASILREVRASFHIPEDAYLVGTVAAMRHQKGYEYLIRAIPMISASAPRAFFVFVGDGPLRPELELLVEELKIKERVRFLGWRFDAAQLLHTLDLFVLPSLYEGLPLAVLEAMAVGLPIIATRVDGTAEVIISGENGILVPPADPQALAESIVQITQNEVLVNSLKKQAYKQMLERYDVSVMISKYLSLYNEIAM
ncbi:MAG: glycosyltransferase [Caldilineaceae bacterium]|jgi:glycosyltransferase involved in cell wall biosynthesis|nr:glycosyltransferase [Caldilineaceae bacterium]